MLLVHQPPPKGKGHILRTKNVIADGPVLRPDDPRSIRSAVVARTVRACAESVRVPSFSRDLLAKTVRLAQETTCNRSRPPLYIYEGL
jgi:hypothetical protein